MGQGLIISTVLFNSLCSLRLYPRRGGEVDQKLNRGVGKG